MKLLFLALLLVSFTTGYSQSAGMVMLDSTQDCSIRGMSIPQDNTIWLSGSKGHVGRSTDGGRSWRWTVVSGYEKTDFRDIEAFDSSTAVIMGIGNPAYILRTTDGGRSWTPVFRKEAPDMFLDAMDFRNARDGICIGDPLIAADGTRRFFILRTSDGGRTWREEPATDCPVAKDGEAVFSASGSNIALLDGKGFNYAFISGGSVSNLHLVGRKGKPGKVLRLGIAQGRESTGAFSMASDRGNAFYIVGGDYKEPARQDSNFIRTVDAGKTWQTGSGGPSGYRSSITLLDGNRLVACGTNGTDVLLPQSGVWTRVSGERFNVCRPSRNGMLFFAGDKGRVGMLRL